MAAHRFSKIVFDGPPPSLTAFACHTCTSKSCVNPKHIYWGTYKSNRDDQIKDGTHIRPSMRGAKNHNAKLKESEAQQIIDAWHSGKFSLSELAHKYAVTKSVICAITQGRTWKHLQPEFRKRVCEPTRGENVFNAKLKDKDVIAIISALKKGVLSQRDIAATYGVNQSVIHQIKSRKSWAHLSDASMTDSVRKKKLSIVDVRAIRKAFNKGENRQQLAGRFGVTWHTINGIVKGTIWKDG